MKPQERAQAAHAAEYLEYCARRVACASQVVQSVLTAAGSTLTPSARTALGDALTSLAFAGCRIDDQRKRLLRKLARKESKR